MNSFLIINADDLGRDSETNRAILTSFQEGYCSSATIMPNMPGFEEACDLVHENKLLKNVGLHLTLRDGYPLTDAMKRFPAFCNADSALAKVSVRSPLFLSAPEKRALADEIRAQISRCRASGLPLTHLDSHYHTHTNPAIASMVIAVALEQGIPHVRLTRNCGPDIGFVKQCIKAMFNRRLKAKKLAGTDYFGSVDDFLYLANANGGALAQRSMEVMVHPIQDANGRIVDWAAQQPIGEVVSRMPHYREAVSYAFAPRARTAEAGAV